MYSVPCLVFAPARDIYVSIYLGALGHSLKTQATQPARPGHIVLAAVTVRYTMYKGTALLRWNHGLAVILFHLVPIVQEITWFTLLHPLHSAPVVCTRGMYASGHGIKLFKNQKNISRHCFGSSNTKMPSNYLPQKIIKIKHAPGPSRMAAIIGHTPGLHHPHLRHGQRHGRALCKKYLKKKKNTIITMTLQDALKTLYTLPRPPPKFANIVP